MWCYIAGGCSAADELRHCAGDTIAGVLSRLPVLELTFTIKHKSKQQRLSTLIPQSAKKTIQSAKMVQIMDNKALKLEIMPGQSPQDVQKQAGDKAGEASEQVQGAAKNAQDSAEATKDQASGQTQSYADMASEKAAGAQKQAGEYQQQGSDYVKSTGKAGEDYAQGQVDNATKAANDMSKQNLPEGYQGYAGQAVDATGQYVTGAVGATGGAVKDLGDTLGNAGELTVCTGYIQSDILLTCYRLRDSLRVGQDWLQLGQRSDGRWQEGREGGREGGRVQVVIQVIISCERGGVSCHDCYLFLDMMMILRI